ncbi:phage tail protein [Mesorhizobium sp. 1M-11]|uniref:phage tail protein n=1 Tax=Mesorhizobium sp. 1M-11 TaxID=1529006 RepID=UPI0006C76F09|nr:phage tail protein [Mesorhizobium sp. 1M-11]
MFQADASDFLHLSRAIAKLPDEIKAKAFARAASRVSETARSRLIKRQAPRLKLPQHLIRERTTAKFNAGGNTAEVVQRSNWISLYKLGARQNAKGVAVRARGSYRHAFIAKMASGHAGVMMREGSERLPIRELFGPNPAHDITNNESVYLKLLAEVIEETLMPRFLHELGRLLPSA